MADMLRTTGRKRSLLVTLLLALFIATLSGAPAQENVEKCGAHMGYKTCGPACPKTCGTELVEQICTLQCVEGCFCEEGYVLDDDKCVKPKDCGCVMDDKYFSIGEKVFKADCSEICKCKRSGADLTCKPVRCDTNAVCGLEDAVTGCFCKEGYMGDGIKCKVQHVTSATSARPPTTSLPPARDCWDLRSTYNITTDGVYNVVSPSGRTRAVRCDMTTDGGGWIVFQKRYNGTVDFNQTFASYKDGFGAFSDEFWMGNHLLHEFTQDNRQKLRVDLCSFSADTRYATYDNFTVGPESDQYRLHVGAYLGDAGNALDYPNSPTPTQSNNQRFSTPDADNDINSRESCALNVHSGWWFADCFRANLNGVYQDHPRWSRGPLWKTWLTKSLKGTEMKFRPAHVSSTNSTAFSCPNY